MPDSIVKQTIREIDPLGADELIGPAARRLIELELPALPAVEADGRFAGIFGEREFMAALFPGYVGELASAAMVSRSVDETIERRSRCSEEPIRPYLTTDRVLVEDEYSDTQLAELFLHHRVLIVEVMGRHAGWIALHGGMAGGANVILLPENRFDIERVCEHIEHRFRTRYSPIVVVAEGAMPLEGQMVTQDADLDAFGHVRLGGIGDWLAKQVEERTAEWSWLGWLPHLVPAHGQDCRLLLAHDRDQATARTTELLRRLDDRLGAKPQLSTEGGGRALSSPSPTAHLTGVGKEQPCLRPLVGREPARSPSPDSASASRR